VFLKGKIRTNFMIYENIEDYGFLIEYFGSEIYKASGPDFKMRAEKFLVEKRYQYAGDEYLERLETNNIYLSLGVIGATISINSIFKNGDFNLLNRDNSIMIENCISNHIDLLKADYLNQEIGVVVNGARTNYARANEKKHFDYLQSKFVIRRKDPELELCY
jgi:hypothetical protein